MYDVICFGSSTVDVFVGTNRSDLITYKDHNKEESLLAYPTGSKILVKELEFTTGGGGTNAAYAFSRLGLKTAYLGKMGDDNNAQLVLDDLKKEKIDSLAILGKGEKTGYSVILDSIKRDRTILAFKGANNNLRFKEINLKKVKTKWFYFSTMMGVSFETLEKMAAYAKKNNIKVALNISEYLARKGITFLSKLLKNVDVFVLNLYESSLLTGKDDIKEIFKKIHSYGPKIVAITSGSDALYVSDNGEVYKAKPHKIKIVETTGAGDAFAASFVTGLIKGKSVEMAIKLGVHNAQSVISYHGAKNKLLRWDEIMKLDKKRDVKVTMV